MSGDQVLLIVMMTVSLTLWSWIGLVPSVALLVSLVAEASGSIRDVIVPELRLKKLHDKGGSSEVETEEKK